MAGSLTVLPQQRTGLGDFVDAASPFLQLAFKNMLERKNRDWEVQKALISSGQAQPISQQMTPMGQQAQQTVEQYPQARIPQRILEQMKQRRTPDFTAGDIPFRYAPSLENQYKQTQINLNKTINDRFQNLSGGDTKFRDASTGQEVDPATAMADIAAGNTNKYIITKVTPTKYGFTETPMIKPEDLTQEEKNYVITSKRIQNRLKNIQDIALPKIKSGKWGIWQSYQAQGVHPLGVKDKEIQRFQSDLQSLKADIPFLRGGKQLTPMEAKRVDMLLDPLGKDEERYSNDIQTFMNEFVSGEQLMLKGVKAFNQPGGTTVGQQQSNDPEYQKYLQAIGG